MPEKPRIEPLDFEAQLTTLTRERDQLKVTLFCVGTERDRALEDLAAARAVNSVLPLALQRVDELKKELRDTTRQRDDAERALQKIAAYVDGGHAVYLLQNPFKAALDLGRKLLTLRNPSKQKKDVPPR